MWRVGSVWTCLGGGEGGVVGWGGGLRVVAGGLG